MTFYEKLKYIWSTQDSLVCVGLDPDLAKIPEHLKTAPHPVFEFIRQIVDATSDLVCAYKPQIAYYSGQGMEEQLEMTLRYLREHCPEVPIILDAKRSDIGLTATMYAREAFDRYGADAVTVNPYLGGDTLTPFLERMDKGVVILCHTSNPGSADLQDLAVGDKKLYQIVAVKAVTTWNTNRNVALVVGATYPSALGEIRVLVDDMPLLVPGIGAQGGDIEAAVKNGLARNGAGLILSASRSILYATSGRDFAKAARQATLNLRDGINRYR